MNTFNISINGVDMTRYAVYPFNFQFTLDDALDQAFVELRNTTVTDAYDAFSLVSITINGEAEPTLYYVSVDNCVVNQKTGRADHKILLIEETKILERVICRAKSFVKPLIPYYNNNTVKSPPVGLEDEEVKEIYGPNNNPVKFYRSRMRSPYDYYYTPVGPAFSAKNVISVWGINSTITLNDMMLLVPSFEVDGEPGTLHLVQWLIEVFDNSGLTRITYNNSGVTDIVGFNLSDYGVALPSKGDSYIVKVYVAFDVYRGNLLSTHSGFATTYNIACVLPVEAPQDLTVTRVTNELLEIADPIMRGETPRFTLNADDALKYANTPCAELNFANGASLWENLLEIGKIIHCIPRLKNNVVYFDKLGSNKRLAEGAFGTPISHTSDKTSEKYATHLDSVVNGMMNLEDSEQGSIYDPFKGGFRTLRSEISNTDMRTTADTAIIRTVEPIERLTQIIVWHDTRQYDITPYVYEKREYDLLYSNEGSYPYAKAFALYYVQGQPNIYGMTYKEKNPISQIFEKYAIENILGAVSGENIDFGDEVLDGVDYVPRGILNLAFNVKYITSVNGRVKQAKRNIDDIKTEAVMAFNQSANRLSSVNYGKRLKGEIAMMGSADIKLVYKTNNWSEIKSAVGKVFQDETYGQNMYISSVNAKMWAGYFLVELGLTKNFNQMGRFVAINSAVRQFEIDTNVSESFFLAEEYLLFTSDTSSVDDVYTVVRQQTIRAETLNVISGNVAATGAKVTIATATTSSETNSELRTVALPVQSLALGNSLLFNFKYEDNYSAGEKLTALVGKQYKLTQLIPYGDPLYGEAKYLGFILGYNASISSNNIITAGDSLPLQPQGFSARWFAKTIQPWIVNKSSRDALNITYQIHYVTDCGIIFGDQLLQGNALVGGTIAAVPLISGGPVINFYAGRVNEMTGDTDEAPISQQGFNYNTYEQFSQITVNTYPDGYSSWNIKDVNGRVLLAKNGPFTPLNIVARKKVGG